MDLKEIGNMKPGKYIALGTGIIGLLIAISVVPATQVAVGASIVALSVAILFS